MRAFLILTGCILTYFIIAILLSIIPCNNDSQPGDIAIYIRSNGVHTDIVVPARNEYKDWTKVIDINNTISKDPEVEYMAFGWGDKGFYLNTPTWNDLKFSTAFKAMFALSTSVMHVSNYKAITEKKNCRKIKVTIEQYKKLVAYIEGSFSKNKSGYFIWVDHHYRDYDTFYDATGKYNLFFTCNSWANEGLKKAGLKSCLWTPFDKGIFYHYD